MTLSDVAVVETQRLGCPGPRALHGEGKSGFCLYCRETAPFHFITQHLGVGLWHTGILMKRMVDHFIFNQSVYVWIHELLKNEEI